MGQAEGEDVEYTLRSEPEAREATSESQNSVQKPLERVNKSNLAGYVESIVNAQEAVHTRGESRIYSTSQSGVRADYKPSGDLTADQNLEKAIQQSKAQNQSMSSDSFEQISAVTSGDITVEDSNGLQSKGDNDVVVGDEDVEASKKAKRTITELKTDEAIDKLRGTISAPHGPSPESEHQSKRTTTERAFPDIEENSPAPLGSRVSSTSPMVAAGAGGSEPPRGNDIPRATESQMPSALPPVPLPTAPLGAGGSAKTEMFNIGEDTTPRSARSVSPYARPTRTEERRIKQLEQENADLKTQQEKIMREAQDKIDQEREKVKQAGQQIAATQVQLRSTEDGHRELSQANVRLHSEGAAQRQRAEKAEQDHSTAEQARIFGHAAGPLPSAARHKLQQEDRRTRGHPQCSAAAAGR